MLDDQYQSMAQDQDVLRGEIRRAGYRVVTKHLRTRRYAAWLYDRNDQLVFEAQRSTEKHAVRKCYWFVADEQRKLAREGLK